MAPGVADADGLTRHPSAPPDPFASNEWAVRPERTKDGCAILLIDPHIPWDEEFRFYEFRAHAGEYNVSGFGPLGTPVVGLGHNNHVGFTCTTGWCQ